LFRHHDLHERNVLVVLNAEGELADVYIIDFDFSIYKPRAEDSNYVIRREIAGQYIRNEIKDKDDYLVNDYLKDN